MKETTIIVNGMQKTVDGKKISFTEVVKLIDPAFTKNSKTVYSVEYENGRGNTKEGVLAIGGEIKIRDCTEFTIIKTGES